MPTEIPDAGDETRRKLEELKELSARLKELETEMRDVLDRIARLVEEPLAGDDAPMAE